MSPNEGSGRPVRHTRVPAHHEGGGLKEHPPELVANSNRTSRKRPLEPRSPQSVHHTRRPKTLRGTSPVNAALVPDNTIVGTPLNGVVGSVFHSRTKLCPKNGITVRRNGVTESRLTNGHLTPESLQYAIDAKLADLDAKINCHGVQVNGHDGKLTGCLKSVRQPEHRTRNSNHDHKQNSTDTRLNGYDIRLNGFSEQDSRRIVESRHIDTESKPNFLDDHQLIANRVPASEPLHLEKEEPLLGARLSVPPDTRANGEIRHSPRHSLPNGLCRNKSIVINNNNNSKSSLNNNNINTGLLQPQYIINNSLKQGVSTLRRPSELALNNQSHEHNLRQSSSSSLPSNCVNDVNNQVNIASSSRVPVYPSSSISNTQSAALSQQIQSMCIPSSCNTSSASGVSSESLLIPSSPLHSVNIYGSSSGQSSGSTSGRSSGTTTPTSGLPPPPADASPTAVGRGPGVAGPTGVRFPVAPVKKDEPEVCKWKDCDKLMEPSVSLLEHIQAVHVEGQLSCESFRCLWVGCKVFERQSCSVTWLERHVLTHGGHKPFKCIVDGCGQRFTSQTALGRHVNQHFNNASSSSSSNNSNNNGSSSNSSNGGPSSVAPRGVPHQSSPSKLFRKGGRKLRLRRQPWSARMFDFFDVSIMEKLQWGLVCVSAATATGQHSHHSQYGKVEHKFGADPTLLENVKKDDLRNSCIIDDGSDPAGGKSPLGKEACGNPAAEGGAGVHNTRTRSAAAAAASLPGESATGDAGDWSPPPVLVRSLSAPSPSSCHLLHVSNKTSVVSPKANGVICASQAKAGDSNSITAVSCSPQTVKSGADKSAHQPPHEAPCDASVHKEEVVRLSSPSDDYGQPYQRDCITLYPKVVGRRISEAGQREELVEWTPADVISNCWMPAGVTPLTLPLTSLTSCGQQTVARLCFPHELQRSTGANRRKRPAHARRQLYTPKCGLNKLEAEDVGAINCNSVNGLTVMSSHVRLTNEGFDKKKINVEKLKKLQNKPIVDRKIINTENKVDLSEKPFLVPFAVK